MQRYLIYMLRKGIVKMSGATGNRTPVAPMVGQPIIHSTSLIIPKVNNK